MGKYLVPELLKMGYKVDAVTLDKTVSYDGNLNYIHIDAKSFEKMSDIVKNEYSAIVDFMIYPTKEEYERFISLYLENTEHYIFLSSYRVYADEEVPITEKSPRILDVTSDKEILQSGDYCIYKAQSEDFLAIAKQGNWTILRPAITYSSRRFQLVTLEFEFVIRSMLEGKKLVLPERALKTPATMSWAGDVAKMMARLILNKMAYGEVYSLCTSEYHTWEEIADIYKQIGGLEYTAVDTDTYLNIFFPNKPHCKRQLELDRYYRRIMDNTKILNAAGLKQSELMPLYNGLKIEYNEFPKNYVNWPTYAEYTTAIERLNDFTKRI